MPTVNFSSSSMAEALQDSTFTKYINDLASESIKRDSKINYFPTSRQLADLTNYTFSLARSVAYLAKDTFHVIHMSHTANKILIATKAGSLIDTKNSVIELKEALIKSYHADKRLIPILEVASKVGALADNLSMVLESAISIATIRVVYRNVLSNLSVSRNSLATTAARVNALTSALGTISFYAGISDLYLGFKDLTSDKHKLNLAQIRSGRSRYGNICIERLNKQSMQDKVSYAKTITFFASSVLPMISSSDIVKKVSAVLALGGSIISISNYAYGLYADKVFENQFRHLALAV